MNSRQRFRATLQNEKPDRIPYLEEGIREDVINAWRIEGFPPDTGLVQFFDLDPRVEIEPELDPLPYETHWPNNCVDLTEFRQHLNPDDPRRLPVDWVELKNSWRNRDRILILRVHRGFFLSLGVDDWQRFSQVMFLIKDNPFFIQELLKLQAELAAQVADRILQQIGVDAALFSEPISANHGPLISPKMYREMVLASYQPLLRVLEKHQISAIILRTYANSRQLLPEIVKAGFNCLWAVECPQNDMDYRSIRAEYGQQLRLIGGINVNVLREGEKAIRQEVEEKVPELMSSGGYIPLLNGRVRAGVSFRNYRYYRHILKQVTLL
jgi:hypothetical protein